MKKLKILLVTDYIALHTGFATVARNIVQRLKDYYDWYQLAWFYNLGFRNPNVPISEDHIYHTKRDPGDMYGAKSFPKLIIDQLKDIDIVWGIGDRWMLDHMVEWNTWKKFYLIVYTPVDSFPLPRSWFKTYNQIDTLVMYTNWAKSIVMRQNPEIGKRCLVIPHGADIEVFKPLSLEEKRAIRTRIDPKLVDAFIVGNFNRNQPRKNIPAMMEAFSYFISPWTTCKNCKRIFYETLPACNACGCQDVVQGPGKDDAYLFLHMVIDSPPEKGWNIREEGGDPGGLIERYGLRKKVIYTKGLKIGKGVSKKELNRLMNMCDITVNPSSAEGFGLPSLESMSAGVPPLVSNYGGHLDFIKDGGETIAIKYFRPQPINNLIWAYVSSHDFAFRLDKLYYTREELAEKYQIDIPVDTKCGKELREAYGKQGRKKVVENYNWDKIALEWKKIFDSVPEKRKSKRLFLTRIAKGGRRSILK